MDLVKQFLESQQNQIKPIKLDRFEFIFLPNPIPINSIAPLICIDDSHTMHFQI